MKRIILNFDGTWQKRNQEFPTNVALIHKVITPQDANGVEQKSFYFDGVGTSGSKFKQTLDGMFGGGLGNAVKEGYKTLIEHYEPGDEVILIGFSRGAYTARTLNGMLYKCGILCPDKCNNPEELTEAAYEFYRNKVKPSSDEAKEFRSKYCIPHRPRTALGCFDTVGSLGIPPQLSLASIFNKWRYSFHDTGINRYTVYAFQLNAIDEMRRNFPITPMELCDDKSTTNLKQIWFAGNHSAVGGGSDKNMNRGLSDIAGIEMIKLLESTGLEFDSTKIAEFFSPDPLFNPSTDFLQKSWMWKIGGLKSPRDVKMAEPCDISVVERWNAISTYRPEALGHFNCEDECGIIQPFSCPIPLEPKV